jgi:hypothetical protein
MVKAFAEKLSQARAPWLKIKLPTIVSARKVLFIFFTAVIYGSDSK